MSLYFPDSALSQDQLIAAIYETMIRPEQFDRFFSAQHGEPCAAGHPFAAGGPPSPALQAHFGRAREIQDRQWIRAGRPHPGNFIDDASRVWLLYDCCGRLLRLSRRAADVPDGGGDPGVLLQLTPESRRRWRQFLERLRSGSFCPDDIVILKTRWPGQKFLCRPVWRGAEAISDAADAAGAPPVAVMAERLEFDWRPGPAARVAGAIGLQGPDLAPLRVLMTGGALPGDAGMRSLARIAARAGAPGLAELVRLTAFLLREQADDLQIARGGRLPAGGSLSGPEGQSTQYFRLGADTGRPVIFVHGLLDLIAPVQRLQPRFRHLGFRVYAPLRGGYGSSSPVPRGQRPLDAFVQQIQTLIQEENLQRPILLAHRGGALFARAAASRLRDRVPGMVAVAANGPVLPGSNFPTLRGLGWAAGFCAARARYLLPLLVNGLTAHGRGYRTLLRSQCAPGSREREQLSQLDLRGVLRKSQALFLQQGSAGFAADMEVMRQGYGRNSGASGVRSVYLHGGEDLTTPLARLRKAVPGVDGAQLRVFREAGTLLLYTCPELVLEALGEFAAAGVQAQDGPQAAELIRFARA